MSCRPGFLIVMAASSMSMRVAFLMIAAALVLAPCSFLTVSAETTEAETKAAKVDIPEELLKEAVPEVVSEPLAKEPLPVVEEKAPSEEVEKVATEESATDESATDQSAPAESLTDQSAPAESLTDQSAPAESAADQSAPAESAADQSAPAESAADQSAPAESAADQSAPAESAADQSAPAVEENTSPLNQQNWSEQIFSSITETVKYVFTIFMSELQKEIDLYSFKEEVNNTEKTENNETAVTLKETVTNETEATNATLESGSSVEIEKNETTVKKPRFHCTGKNITENTTGIVQMVNGTTLLQRLAFENNASGSECILVFFYAPWCHFSALAASSYNTLGRAYPQLDIMAVDAVQFSSLNARFGVVSVPNIIFFHQSRSVVRFNSSKKTFENMVLFVKNMTGLEADKSVEVSEQDLIGPISSIPTSEPDYLLWLAWMFINVCSLYMFYVSSLGQQLINKVHTLWQEHQHIE